MRSQKEEERCERQKYYGLYCIICRRRNIVIKPFYDFSLNDYFNLKEVE